ncbi:sodium channel protein 1 brain-like isoform X2 [Rhopilema esculentum]|uniref:sodium channel protein 1 brain-like isoform X2 n=1 Tax=Rhopilema esculentum TaxID=499914 RepID=UPI0031D35D2B
MGRSITRTFLVLSQRLGKIYVYRFNKSRSLWLLGPKNPIRKLSILIITNQFFEFFVVLTILINCIFLALDNPPEEAEYVFTAIYTIEMILKIVAKGYVLHSYAYLRDPWNWLDFVVVCLGYITITPKVSNFTGIRTFRVLRALRTISAVEGLKTMVNALLKSMRLLSDVLALTTFFICVFALLGLQLFSGYLRNKCVLTPTNSSLPYAQHVLNKANWYPTDGSTMVCGNASTSRLCPENYTCFRDIGENPNYGYTSFDHFGWALLTSVQLVTMDYWENVYFHVISSTGSWCIFYFMIVVFFGSFYLINLVLAVVALSYEQEAENIANREKYYEQLKTIASSYSLHNKFVPVLLFDLPSPVLHTTDRLPDVVVFDQNQQTILRPFGRRRRQTIQAQPSPHVFRSAIHPSPDPAAIVRAKTDSKLAMTSNGHQTIPIPQHGTAMSLSSLMSEASTSSSPDKNFSSTDSDQTLQWRPYQNLDHDELSSFQRIRLKIFYVVSNQMFEFAVTAFIFLNTLCLSLEYHGMNPFFKDALVALNHVFTSVFLTEMILKIIAYGLRRYLSSRWNLFDGLVVIISMIDLLVEAATNKDNSTLSILRSFRLLRVLKLAQSWSTMRSLLGAIGRSINAMGHLTLILAIIIYMFALVGIQLFGEEYTPNKFPSGKTPRWNFVDFPHSFMMLFRILCGEWIEPLYDCMKATSTWSIAFFMPALVVGNFLVLNLFLALLLSSLADEAFEQELKRRDKQRRNQIKRLKKILTLQSVLKKFGARAPQSSGEPTKRPRFAAIVDKTKKKASVRHNDDERRRITQAIAQEKSKTLQPIKEDTSNNNQKETVSADDPQPCFPCCSLAASLPWSNSGCCGKREKEFLKIRIVFRKIVENKWFDNGILVLIIASSSVLVFEDIHLPSKPTLETFLEGLNIFFCLVFFLEFCMKIIGWGVYSYLRNPWNCLDFFIVVISIAAVIGSFTNSKGSLSAFRSIRTLRALRPLRAISRWEGIKIVVNSLFQAIPNIGNVLLVCAMFWLIFSIMGVQFFGGKFYKCVDESGLILSAKIIQDRNSCISANHYWMNSNANFDNALNGFLALLQVATFEGWMEVMRDAVDAVGIDKQPKFEANFYAYFYFVIFIIIGSFFVLNLFISVIIDNFYRMKKRYDDGGDFSIFLTSNQRTWFNTLRKAVNKKPKKSLYRPEVQWQANLFDFIQSVKFETFIMVLILLNMFLMMISHDEQPDSITTALRYCNIGFTVLFVLEAVLKILALQAQYFRSAWNVFDFIVLVLSIAGIVLEFLNVNLMVTPNVLRVMRVLRIGRLLRYFKAAKGIRRQLVALVISLPALFNIGTLLFLTLFIYAIIGMTSFGHVKKTGAIDEVVNFETFGQSMLVLFRLSTSAGWNEILDSLMIQPPNCDPTYRGLPNGNCGQPWLAVLYMVTFILVTFMVIVNMYIAVILENFNQATEDEEIGVTDDDIQMFYSHWQKYDPHATQYIEYSRLSDFLDELDPPLQISKPNETACLKLAIPIRDNDKIHCADVLLAALKHTVVGHIEETDEETLKYISNTIESKLLSAFPIRAKDPTLSSTAQRIQEINAAITIQKIYKRWKRRKRKVEEERENMSLEMKTFSDSCTDDKSNEKLEEENAAEVSRQNELPIQIDVKSENSSPEHTCASPQLNGPSQTGDAASQSLVNSSPKSKHMLIRVETRNCSNSFSE